MAKDPQEWMWQARYDMRTAEYLLRGRRYGYALFMCHLSLEKALKGIFEKEKGKAPPRTHNLLYLIESLALATPEELLQSITRLNRLSVLTRYPEDLREMQRQLGPARTRKLIQEGKEALRWLGRRFNEP